MALTTHKVADLFPEMSEYEYTGLVEDIRQYGQRVPILVHDGKILDGRSRYKACRELGVEPKTKEWDEKDTEWIAAKGLNLIRRHMSQEQVACVYKVAEEELPELRKGKEIARAAAVEAQKSGKDASGEAGGRGKKKTLRSVGRKVSSERDARTVDAKRAASAGTSQRTLRRVDAIWKKDEDGVRKIAAGVLKPKDVTNALKKQDRAERVAKSEATTPEGKFRTIVIDPPWDYDNKSRRSSPDYRDDMMSFEEIEKFDLARWIPDDAGHIYLWVTDVYAGDVNRLFRKWGYEPVATLVWVKSKWGLGSYFRHKHELCFFGVKGRLPAKRNDVSTVFEAPWTGNSVKPEKFYEIVESMSPGPKLIVFSRKQREGWSVFGNEVQ